LADELLESSGGGHYIAVVGQGQRLHGLGRIQREGVLEEIEVLLILGAIAVVAIGHGERRGLTGIALRARPVTEALGEFRGRSVGVGDDDLLGVLWPLNAGSEQIELFELARGERNRLAGSVDNVVHVGRGQVEDQPV